jgi:hypothetical protein
MRVCTASHDGSVMAWAGAVISALCVSCPSMNAESSGYAPETSM